MLERIISGAPYLGLYVVLLLGGVGIPIPEELPIITAGVLAHRGVVVWWLALGVCIAGVLTGDVILYAVGRRWGDHVLERPFVQRFLDAKRRDSLEASYRRYGMLIVFGGRHVIGFRTAAFVMAGVVKLPFWKFLTADGVAVCIGIPVNFGIAYLFTEHLHAILADVRRVESWLALALLIGGAAWYGFATWRRGQRVMSSAA